MLMSYPSIDKYFFWTSIPRFMCSRCSELVHFAIGVLEDAAADVPEILFTILAVG
jgi:hypothetical protein